MPAAIVLSLRPGVAVEPSEFGALRIAGPESRLVCQNLSGPVASTVTQLAEGGDEESLADTVLEQGGPSALAEWYYTLGALERRGWLVRVLHDDDRPLASLIPCAPEARVIGAPGPADRSYLLSRFAFLRRVGDVWQLESPTATHRLVLHDPTILAILALLANPSSAATLRAHAGGLSEDCVTQLLKLLASAGFVVAAKAREPEPEDADPSLRGWEFHDLLFHARTRRGRTDAPLGASFRFAGRVDPPPALKPALEAETVALDRPDLANLTGGNVPLPHLVDARRSIRSYADTPISVRQLAEFLFRVARVSRTYESEVDTPIGPLTMEFALRPYPSGGGLYELEFYVAVRSCGGLAPGLYRYQADAHRLGLVRRPTPDVDHLFADAAASSGIDPATIQILLIVSARFLRISWKYASIAYALILKHVGVVYQTMYLTATAMGLAPCALGAGDSDRFARAAGLDYYAETSVGEFLLGSKDGSAITPGSA